MKPQTPACYWPIIRQYNNCRKRLGLLHVGLLTILRCRICIAEGIVHSKLDQMPVPLDARSKA